jgi:hypothetical protein
MIKKIEPSGKNTITSLLYEEGKIWGCSEDSIKIFSKEGEEIKTINSSGYSQCKTKDKIWVSSDNEILIFDSVTMEQVSSIPVSFHFHLMKFFGDHVWCASSLNNIVSFHSSSFSLSSEIKDAHEHRVNDFAFVNNEIWSASDDDTIAVWTKEVFLFFVFIFIFDFLNIFI